MSKVLWEWIPNVGSKAREGAERNSTLNVSRECTPLKNNNKKQQQQQLINKQHWVLSVTLPTGILHLQLAQSSYCSGNLGQSLTSTALAIINTTHLGGGGGGGGGIAYSEGTDFGRPEQKVSRVGAAATSSVRSFQSLIALGKRRISWIPLGIKGNGNDRLLWHWDSNLVFTWWWWNL